MTRVTRYYRFPSEDAFNALTPPDWTREAQDEEGNPLPDEVHYSGEAYYCARIGAIVTEAGTYDEEGVEITPPVIDTGYHVNLTQRADQEWPSGWDQYQIHPTSPVRVLQ